MGSSRAGCPPPVGGTLLTLDDINEKRYGLGVIRSFRDAETGKVFQRERSRRLPPALQRQAHRKLLLLDAAEALKELRIPPGNRLERLSGDRAGQHSIRINDQWRVCFRWDRGDAYDVEITDYQ
jgi:proteic killer suppression protein